MVRGSKREVLSRGYNVLVRAVLAARFSDAQCGFKAIRADRARLVLPLVQDTGWFFDTELLVLAERAGMRIHEVPVDWVDDPDSRVDIARTVLVDLRGITRLLRDLGAGRIPLSSIRSQVLAEAPVRSFAGQLWRFCVVGVGSTLAYLLLYLLLRPGIGAQAGNFIALAATAIGNTAVNRRFTFGVTGSTGWLRQQVQGLMVFLLGWGLTAGALWLIDAHHHDRPVLEVSVLVGANLLATALRFALLRSWVFRRAACTTAARTSPPLRPATRWALAAILAGNALIGLWDLGRMGWQNTYYAAADLAGSQSWHAFFFAGLDSAGGATVDKPPLAFWVDGLSIRLFGMNSWALLVPQVLLGLLAAATLFGAVRRLAGDLAGLLAAAALTLTPVAVWMFRADNPDALMTTLLVVAAYCTVRALSAASIGWTAAAGLAVGLAFEAKMLEAVLIVPAMLAAVLLCSGGRWWRRTVASAVVAAVAAVTGLAWMVWVQSVPAGSRPYVASTATNSEFELAFGYNGLQRVNAGHGIAWAQSDRLFTGTMGSLAGYLLPAALLGVLVLLVLSRGRCRSPEAAAAVLFGGWLLTAGLTLTYSRGLVNVYYVLVLAPSIAALAGIAVAGMWARRAHPAARLGLLLMLVTAAVTGALLLPADARTAALLAVCALAFVAACVALRQRPVASVTLLCAALLVPTAVAAVQQISVHHEPPLALSGDATALAELRADRSGAEWLAAVQGGAPAADLELQTGRAVLDIGGYHGLDPQPTVTDVEQLIQHRRIRYLEMFLPQRHTAPHTGHGAGTPRAVTNQLAMTHATPTRIVTTEVSRVPSVARVGSTALSGSLATSHRSPAMTARPVPAARTVVALPRATTGPPTPTGRPAAHHRTLSAPRSASPSRKVQASRSTNWSEIVSWAQAHYKVVYTDGTVSMVDLFAPLHQSATVRTAMGLQAFHPRIRPSSRG